MEAREYVTLTNSASKRALFQSGSLRQCARSDDEDSLGHMSPLKSSPDRYSSPLCSPSGSDTTPLKMAGTERSLLSSRLKMMESIPNFRSAVIAETPQKDLTDVVGDTPEKETTNDMLTPLKCLIQRRSIEETPDSAISKNSEIVRRLLWRKTEKLARSPEKTEVQEKKNFDFNSNVANLIRSSFYRPEQSKAKTVLFSDIIKAKRPTLKTTLKMNPVRRSGVSHGGNNRKTHKIPRVILGQINAGVRHRVKKPKQKVKPKEIRKSLEKPLISPEDRIQKFMMDNELDEENIPAKRPRLENNSHNNYSNDRSKELKSLSFQVQSMNMNMSVDEEPPKSPEIEVVPDPNKKFFKTNRTMAIDHKATVTVVNNVRIQVHKGKMILGNSPARKVKPFKKRLVVLEKVFEEDTGLETSAVQSTIENVLKKLDSEIEETPVTHINGSMALSIQSDCEMVNSYHKGEQLNLHEDAKEKELLEVVEGSPGNSQKLYPVFCKRKALHDASNTPPKKVSPHFKKMRLIGEDQYQIDAGQSRFRAIHCKECGTMYHVGDPEDEIAHYNIHHNISTFKFVGWKNEHVVKLYENSERIIVVYPDDPKVWVKKVLDVLKVVDKEMGFVDYNVTHIGNYKVYLYIHKSRIIGVLAAEPKSAAHRMLYTGVEGPDCCSEESFPIVCGVSRIWAAPDQRRRGVATRLVDALRLTFMFDHILDKKEIAFSVPTENGKAFAIKYMNTAEFMVYYN